ncbi:RHS repeat domain-containing protein [Microbulbifer aggregans]|uniref:RHS repeat domain-containing protein n=1 Tax=Microbulbifer aggregans TaxID=1769779 RepID=UPI001CFC9A84|nr:RHS repeat-associated core domain-containing protein [Microbulbifer aggregans]
MMNLTRVILSTLLVLTYSTVSLAEVTVTYLHTDALGSVVAASDENGDLQWRKSYLPYGRKHVDGQSKSPAVGFTGHTQDNKTGLTYMKARSYDPDLGRFIQMDPAAALDHTESNPMMFNRFAYANDNPYKYIDPDGRDPWLVLGAQEMAVITGEAMGVDPYSRSGAEAIGQQWQQEAIVQAEVMAAMATAGEGAVLLSGVKQKTKNIFTKGAADAAKRLGVDLDKISVTNGVGRAKIDLSSSLDPGDINKIKDVFKGRGASKAEIDTGFIANEKLDAFLRRRVQDGKPFNGGTVRNSTSKDSDFTIDFDL